MRLRLFGAGLSAITVAFCAPALSAQSAELGRPGMPVAAAAVGHVTVGTSIRPLQGGKVAVPEPYPIPLDPTNVAVGDLVRGNEPAPSAPAAPDADAPSVGQSFQGATQTNSIPPDTMGAVSPSYVVNTVNGALTVQTRAGALQSQMSLDQFWNPVISGLGVGSFDPRIQWDPFAQRFLMISVAGSNANSSVLVAASQSSNPMGGWWMERFDSDGSNTVWADFPQLGFNNQWIGLAFSKYAISGGAYSGSEMWVLDKSSMYASQSTGSFAWNSSYFNPAPAVTLDAGQNDLYWVSQTSGVELLRISGSVSSPGLVDVGHASASYASYGGAHGQQAGESRNLELADPRVYSVIFRNGSIWAAHSIGLPASLPTHSAIQWWQLSTSAGQLQRGTIEDPSANVNYSFGSLAVNKYSDVAVGFGRFSASTYASGAYAFRYSSDSPSTMRAPATLKSGEAPYFQDYGAGKNRWGDYSNTVVDPANDESFWTVQEYAWTPSGSSSRWATWWSRIDPTNTATVAASPAVINFGDMGVPGESAPQTVTVTSTGSLPVTVSSLSISSNFKITADQCSSIALNTDQSCTIAVAFKPATSGTKNGTLSIFSNANNGTQIVSLTGRGIPDQVPPETVFTSGAVAALTIDGTATDTASGVARVEVVAVSVATGATAFDADATLTCNDTNQQCTWSIATPLIPGLYTVRATATDIAGNTDPTPASGVFVTV